MTPACGPRAPSRQRRRAGAAARTTASWAPGVDSSIEAAASEPRASIRAEPSGVQTATTLIRFSVSVPVLSAQMNVVAPSVSTDSSAAHECVLLGHALGTDRQ